MRRLSACALVLALAGCNNPDNIDDGPAVLEQYAAVMYAQYDDSVRGAEGIETAVVPLTTSATPTQAQLTAARTAWVESRPAYLQTEVARFYEGPIDDPDTGPEGLINSWPLDERYIDYVVGAGDEILWDGIVNDPTLLATVDEEGIAGLNQINGASPDESEANVSVGYHAIEFLLWGQDLSADGAGERPVTDYIEGDPAGMNQDRRRAYLAAASSLLVSDLETVRDAWAPDTAGNYRADFEALEPREGLRRILFGMGSLSGGELAQERMNVAYTTKDQNDEHSCFSDTTLQDQLYDAQGIQNVYLGRYTRTDGTVVQGASLSAMVAARNPELDARFRAELQASLDAIRAIPGTFDTAILGEDSAPGRVAILAAINALRAQTETIVEIADLFGVRLNLE